MLCWSSYIYCPQISLGKLLSNRWVLHILGKGCTKNPENSVAWWGKTIFTPSNRSLGSPHLHASTLFIPLEWTYRTPHLVHTYITQALTIPLHTKNPCQTPVLPRKKVLFVDLAKYLSQGHSSKLPQGVYTSRISPFSPSSRERIWVIHSSLTTAYLLLILARNSIYSYFLSSYSPPSHLSWPLSLLRDGWHHKQYRTPLFFFVPLVVLIDPDGHL